MEAADGPQLAGGRTNVAVEPNSVFTLTGSTPKS